MKCHSEPENHKKLLYYHKTTLSQWEIYIADTGKKIGRICSLLVSQNKKYVIGTS